MALPIVPGWILDYPTARHIFEEENKKKQREIVKLVANGQVRICECEEADFRANEVLRPVFFGGHDCVVGLEDEIIDLAVRLPERVARKELQVRDRTTKLIVATVIHLRFGLVSIRSGPLLTPLDLARARGAVALTCQEFLDEL